MYVGLCEVRCMSEYTPSDNVGVFQIREMAV